MSEKQILDYRPILAMEREVDSPSLAIEDYVDPNKSLTKVIQLYKENKPSTVVNIGNLAILSIKEKLKDLDNHIEIEEYVSASHSSSKAMIEESINFIDGNTNILLYNRLITVQNELEKLLNAFIECMYDSTQTESDLIDIDKKIENMFIEYELTGHHSKINYEALNYDMKIIILVKDYLTYLIEFADNLIISNDPIENNIEAVDQTGKTILELNYKNIKKILVDNRNIMDYNFSKEIVLNRFKKLYNLRTKLLSIEKGLSKEEIKRYISYLNTSKDELSNELNEAIKDFYKSSQMQYLCLNDFNKGFQQKCEMIYNLKGGHL